MDRKLGPAVVVKSWGNQDEDVDILDDGDRDRTPLVAAGVSRDGIGVGTPPKSGLPRSTTPRVAVDRRMEQRTASIAGRGTVPRLVAREDGSSKYPGAIVPKVASEGTSKQSDFQKKQISAKSSAHLAVTQQHQSKRKVSEAGPSTSALKKKDILQGGGQKSPPVTVKGKRRMLILADDSDEEFFEPTTAINDGDQKPKASMRLSDSTEPLRSTVPLNAKTEMHPHTEAAPAETLDADEENYWQWITCTKCKKIRLTNALNADEELDISSWSCEKNTLDPKFASCSAPHQEVPVLPYSKYVEEIERKERVGRSMVWVKVRVDGEHVWWPGLQVKVFPAAIQKLIDETADNPGRAVRLFHPPKGLGLYQVVRKSSLKPFFMRGYRNSTSHPDFEVAVTEADRYLDGSDMEVRQD